VRKPRNNNNNNNNEKKKKKEKKNHSSKAAASAAENNNTSNRDMSKQSVLKLRNQHFSRAVSISYSNSDGDCGGLMIMRGRGSKLYDETNQEYLDTRNNVCHVGHCHSKVVDAVTDQLSTLNTNTRYLHPNSVMLAKRLTDLLPDPLDVVFFVNSGSEANDLALRLARAHTQSKNTIVVEGGYHGHTLSLLKISPYKYSKGTEFPLIDHHHHPEGSSPRGGEGRTPEAHFKTPSHDVYQVPVPDMYRGRHRCHHHYTDEEEKRNEEDRIGKQYARYVEDACDYYTITKNQKVGSFIIEGGMSVGGVILPPSSFFENSVRAVRNAGGVWIADEVQTGFGRLGPGPHRFWAFQHHYASDDDDDDDNNKSDTTRVVPDIVTMGKPMGNGMALGAVVTTREIAKSFERLGIEYFNTFGGNPVSCAAGLAVLDILEEENLPEHALGMGRYLRSKFERLNCRWIGDIRGSGLFMGIELIRPRRHRRRLPHLSTPDSTSYQDEDNKTKIRKSEGVHGQRQETEIVPATTETSFICTVLKDKYHILTSIDGLDDNVLVIKPPMVFSTKDADYFVDCFDMTIQELDELLDVDDDQDALRRLGRTPT
jgi:ethanolamine-phosphate phospho-lyase